jgi:hypothetical protein
MLAAFLIFLAGVPHYRREPPPEKGGKDAALCSVFRCVWHAGRAQLGAWLGRLGARERAAAAKPDHWLDRAVPVYGEQVLKLIKI